MAVLMLSALSAAAGEQRAVLPVTADTGIAYVRGKERFSNGGGPTSALRQNQHWQGFENKTLLMGFDTRAIRGWTVSRAELRITLARGKLYGAGLCTVLAPWSEGKAMNWVERAGASCWDFARCPRQGEKPTSSHYWAWPGSSFYSVCWAHPAARYSHAGPGRLRAEPTADKRFVRVTIPVDPALVHDLAIGAAYGLVLTDDKGQVAESYALHGDARPYLYDESQDVFVFTRNVQAPALRPVLVVVGEAVDKTPPAAPADVRVSQVAPSDGTITLTFTAPGDDGPAGTAQAYEAAWQEVGTSAPAAPLPRWSLPRPVTGGEPQRLPVFTLPPGRYELAIRAVDEAGNRGPAAKVAVTVPKPPDATLVKAQATDAAAPTPAAPANENLSVYACPDVAKVEPVTGHVLRDGAAFAPDPAFASANPVWRADGKLIRLQAAANEVVAFKLIIKKGAQPLTGVRVSAGDLSGPGGAKIAAEPNVRSFRVWYVDTGLLTPRGYRPAGSPPAARGKRIWHGDACLPLEAPFDRAFSVPSPDNRIDSQQYQAVWVDVYVPRGTRSGLYNGKITVRAEGLDRPVTLNLALNVLGLALPDELSWRVEMNRYGPVTGYAGVSKADAVKAERLYYQLAHRHRTVLNMLSYTQSSSGYTGLLPQMAGQGTDVRVADWAAWDKRFGPLFDGSAFSAKGGYVGPGADTPIAHFYLPFCEGWPVKLNKQTYRDYAVLKTRLDFAEWAKTSRPLAETISQDYRRAFARVVRQYFEHFGQKGWHRTRFQVFFNNKYYFKLPYFAGGFTGNGTSFWLLDEPIDYDDYAADRFYVKLAREGYDAAGASSVRVEYRLDVSQPYLTRGLWDDLGGLCVTSGGLRFAPTVAARQRWLPDEAYWHYGQRPSVGDAHISMIRLFLKSWCAGAVGTVPYWNFGGESWRTPNALATIWTGKKYAGGPKSYIGAIPGARLKVIRRAQQDIEYLNLLARCEGWDRARVRAALKPYADNPAAPVLTFEGLSADQWVELRGSLAATILLARKQPKVAMQSTQP